MKEAVRFVMVYHSKIPKMGSLYATCGHKYPNSKVAREYLQLSI